MRDRSVGKLDFMSVLKRDVEELKRAQRVAGHNMVGYYTASEDPNDYSFTLTAFATKSFTITFEHDKNKFGSIQQLFLFYGLNDPAVATDPYPAWANGPPVFYYIQKLPPTDTQNQWLVYAINLGSSTWTVYWKAYFKGSDSGVFTFT